MKQEKKRIYLRAALALVVLLAVLLALDNLSFVPSMLLTVLRKGAIYALVAVSMNLLNGFTGLFSLGQAGFMLLGAYTYAILTIPAAAQKSIYQRYANGGIGSVSGSIIASFLFIASSEWLLRFLDNETYIGGFRVPLLRSGFRMVVFSIIIMAVVLFFRKGIMGDRELFQKKPASTAKAAKKEVRSK